MKPKYYLTQKAKETKKRYREKVHDIAIDKLGGKCNNPACQWLNADGTRGCNDRRCLQIDHINGNGYEERKHTKSQKIYIKINKGFIEDYQLLCANCNWIKRVCNNEVRGGS